LRTSLIIEQATAQQILTAAAEEGVPFYTECNRLLRLGLGYRLLFGTGPGHTHKYEWKPKLDHSGDTELRCECGEHR